VHDRRERVDQELNVAIGQCAALLPHALALLQIANAPARNLDYRAPNEIAEGVSRDLARSFVGTAAGIALRYGESGRSARRFLFPMFRGLSRLGLTASRMNVAVAALDITTDALLAGADQNEREVVRNIYLIGDYAEALKVLFRERGAGAAASPEYRAIRGELERLRDEMPGGEIEFLIDSAAQPEALVGAFLSLAQRYAGARVTRLVASGVPPLPASARLDTSAPVLRALRQANIASLVIPANVATRRLISAAEREGGGVANRMYNVEPGQR
jgi:hypothetical protein